MLLALIRSFARFYVSPNVAGSLVVSVIYYTYIAREARSAPIAQSGEHWIAELTGSESPLRRSLFAPDWDCLRSVAAAALKAS